MRRGAVLVGPAILASALALAPAALQEGASREGAREGGGEAGALQRIPPVPIERESTSGPGSAQRDMRANAIEWRGLLTSADLDVRERCYEEILRRARIDPLARDFFERLAREPKNLELAWTGRLALRELGPPPSVPFRAIESDLFSLDAGIDRMLAEMLGASPEAGFSLPTRNRLRIQGLVPTTGTSRSVTVQENSEGARVIVVDRDATAAGDRERVYEGTSLAEILAAHPELADEIDLSLEGGVTPLRRRLNARAEGGLRALLGPFAYGDRRREAGDPRAWFGSIEGLFSPSKRSELARTDVLGVRVRGLTAERASAVGVAAGLEVLRTEPGTIAERLGVTAGDVLVVLDGTRLTRPEQITARFAERTAHERLVLTWIDDLGQRQVGAWEPDAAAPGDGGPSRY